MSELEFDYVIVGGGSAGCVLANRLSADPALRVCLIEAGPRDRHPLIHIPAGVIGLINHRKLDWRFKTVPQTGAAGRAIDVPRGRTLGGSSAINGMVYMRGHPRDYDDWEAAGNRGWAFRHVLPYFRRSENNETWTDSPYHGQGGPLNVTDLKAYNKLVDVFFEATDSLQMPRTVDFNGPQQEGFATRQLTQRNGRRESTATAFLKPARDRRNLTVLTSAEASCVELEGRRAVGVALRDGREVRALREVVLTAGAIGSPFILMHSGIGPGELLRQNGVTVRHDLPGVGRNLQDHASIGIKYTSPSSVPYGVSLRAAPRLAWNVLEYLLFRRGPFASNIMEAGGFLRTDPRLERPDIQFIFLPGNRGAAGSVVPFGHGYALFAVLLRPYSRGHIGLRGNDPSSSPVIDPNFFADDRDLENLARGAKLARRILDAPAFAPYRGQELQPGPAVQSDAELQDFVRKYAATVFHPAGTCKMGIDPAAVVDPDLRVHGIDGLRVVDASVMPTLIGGNTNAPVIMIAEKAADLILGRPAPQPATVA